MLSIREKRPQDNEWFSAILRAHFGSPVVVARGRRYAPLQLPGFVAEEGGAPLGAVTFARLGDEIEIVTLGSVVEDRGTGTALLEAVVTLARAEGARRVCLITSNDNIRAIRFYQKRGWDMVAVHRDAVTRARALKPEIPPTGEHGIAIRHEIEFELLLNA